MHPHRSNILLTCAFAFSVFMFTNVAGCASDTVSTPPARQSSAAFGESGVRPGGDVVYAVIGQPVIIPLSAGPAAATAIGPGTNQRRSAPDTSQQPSLWWPRHEPSISYGGRPVPARVYWLGGQTPTSTKSAHWLDAGQAWRAVPLSDMLAGSNTLEMMQQDDAGFWIAVLDLPRDQTPTSRVRIDRQFLPVQWVDAPREADTALLPRLTAQGAATDELLNILKSHQHDAMRAWRIELLADRFSVLRRELDRDQAEHTTAHAVSGHITNLWRSGLDRLAQIDRRLAAQVLARLTAVVRTPDGRLLPAWSTDASAESHLLRVLLDNKLSPEVVKNTALSWLGTEAGLTAWVVDDAGGVGSSQSVRIGVADRTGARQRATLKGVNQHPSATAQLMPHDSALLQGVLPAGRVGARTLVVQSQEVQFNVPVIAGRASGGAPGLKVHRLYEPWTMHRWLRGSPTTPAQAEATTALLQRDALTGNWQLYIECRSGNRSSEIATNADRVTLWLGPYGSTRARIEVSAAGGVLDRLSARPRNDLLLAHEVSDTGWRAIVELPQNAADQNNILYFAMSRSLPTDLGEQSAHSWPRPMLPGQREPGRLAVDLRVWE